ncbi:MAG: hypothetical protein CVU57_06385 [Deltaproteobacteria bacterium HGW-Deltaproteobacteria-15]|jgi:hypothetical protein|nr:MAG: hypothetical protein CVU57_06385 [Deltaproteobacteria bacterium HGW-Deltaproteobacteria-15]
MKCAICGIAIDSLNQAIDQGWEPYFYEGEKEHEFACPNCAEVFLQVDENGEMEVKPEYRGKITYRDEEAGKDDILLVGVITNEDEDPKH